jgi:hypothetical protein
LSALRSLKFFVELAWALSRGSAKLGEATRRKIHSGWFERAITTPCRVNTNSKGDVPTAFAAAPSRKRLLWVESGHLQNRA